MLLTALKLTKNEKKVLDCLKNESEVSVLQISRKTQVPRTSVYLSVQSLLKRRLVSKTYKDKHLFYRSHDADLFKKTDNLGSIIKVFVGKQEFENIMKNLFSRKDSLIYTVQSKESDSVWLKHFSKDEMVELNSLAKNAKVISKHIFSRGLLEKAIRLYGEDWAKNYVGRKGSAFEIDDKYVSSKCQLWVTLSHVYFVNIEDLQIIKIENYQIARLIFGILDYIYSHEHAINFNEKLKSLVS
jgi:predicted transcriptional regulator